MLIEPDKIYLHKETGSVYKVIYLGLVKLETGWTLCVSYVPVIGSTMYTRTEQDFLENFEPLEGEDE